MSKVTCFSSLLSLFGLLVIAPAVKAAGQAGGSYYLSINGGSAIALATIDYGETSAANGNGSAGRVSLSPVTITTAGGGEAIAELVTHCVTGAHYPSMLATYKNAQGQAQFDVKFEDPVVTSVTLPAVDKTASAPGDITVVFSVKTEAVETPPSGSRASSIDEALPQLTFRQQPILKRWVAPQVLRIPVAPSGKFSLTLDKCDTSGVLAISSFKVNSPLDVATGRSTGKIDLTPLTLNVDATKTLTFTVGKHILSGTLVYNRQNDMGQNEVVTIILQGLTITSSNLNGSTGSAPVFTVQITFTRLAIKGAKSTTSDSWNVAMNKGS